MEEGGGLSVPFFSHVPLDCELAHAPVGPMNRSGERVVSAEAGHSVRCPPAVACSGRTTGFGERWQAVRLPAPASAKLTWRRTLPERWSLTGVGLREGGRR